MDTSEVYIKMSHLAFPKHEILPVGKTNKVSPNIYIDDTGQWWADWRGWFVPLYRQDQLQEMVDSLKGPYWPEHTFTPGYHVHRILFDLLKAFVDDTSSEIDNCELDEYARQFDSMEQLWLAFVMKDNNKTWNGEEWK